MLAQKKASQCYLNLKFFNLDPLVDKKPISLTDALLRAHEETGKEMTKEAIKTVEDSVGPKGVSRKRALKERAYRDWASGEGQ